MAFSTEFFCHYIASVAIAASDNHTIKLHNFGSEKTAYTDSSLGGMRVDDFFLEALKFTHAYSAFSTV